MKVVGRKYAGEKGRYEYNFFNNNNQAEPEVFLTLDGNIGVRVKLEDIEKEHGFLAQLKDLPRLNPEELSKQLELPLDLKGDDLNKKEVLDLIKQTINATILIPELAQYSKNLVRYALVKIDNRRGWAEFGCNNFSEFLIKKCDLFEKAYSSLQKEWQAGRLETGVLKIKIGTLTESQAREFYRLLENPDDCRKAYLEAVEIACSDNVKLTAKIIRSVVNRMLGLEEKAQFKSNCGWVHGSQGSRHYRIKIADFKLDLQDVYQDTAVQLEKLSVQEEKSPETLLTENMVKFISAQLQCTEAAAIAAVVNFIQSK
ncbi:MAG: hypothetical protein HC836_38765 [Richelia sp. RM2_1_2]|nr:hypothetical protein [Richelia sp. RM2_1_2]